MLYQCALVDSYEETSRPKLGRFLERLAVFVARERLRVGNPPSKVFMLVRIARVVL